MIEVKNVTKTYGKKDNVFTALDNVSLKILTGSTVAIVGKSGSGKSTLMHVMSGLDRPTSGSIKVDGLELAEMKPKALDKFRATEMSFIFQAFFVEGNQSVYQNVMLPLEIAEVSRKNRRKMVEAALKAVELDDKIDNKAVNLSGGQKQRLAVARSIVNKPKLIFADEPTGNLDSATGYKIIDLLFRLNKSIGCTIVIVTHDHDLAARCAVQISIRDGKIESVRESKPTNVARAKIARGVLR